MELHQRKWCTVCEAYYTYDDTDNYDDTEPCPICSETECTRDHVIEGVD